ncbi:DUF1707 and DUF4190 domain-containing protein [Kitasatospora sp. NPDC097643]|uniref:DUF1707 and DUF4190 domain-containing protein n=1 Tax=Kitasatospora sp. NPDC097643 TaxID=3157230 RepID=UPI00332B8738
MAVQPWGETGPGFAERRPAGGWQPVPGPQAGMRAGHADRDRTVDVLKAAFAEGRLSAEEFEQRHEAAAAAQTYGQLATLVADLPSGPMVTPVAYAAPPVPATFLPPPPPRPAPPARTSGLAVTAMVLGLTGLSLPAVVVGHVAKSRVSRRDVDGDWMATLGLIFGYAGCVIWTVLLAVLFRAPW